MLNHTHRNNNTCNGAVLARGGRGALHGWGAHWAAPGPPHTCCKGRAGAGAAAYSKVWNRGRREASSVPQKEAPPSVAPRAPAGPHREGDEVLWLRRAVALPAWLASALAPAPLQPSTGSLQGARRAARSAAAAAAAAAAGIIKSGSGDHHPGDQDQLAILRWVPSVVECTRWQALQALMQAPGRAAVPIMKPLFFSHSPAPDQLCGRREERRGWGGGGGGGSRWCAQSRLAYRAVLS